MSQESLTTTANDQPREPYLHRQHELIQRWGERVAPAFEALPEDERLPREAFFEHLMTSIDRGDTATANALEAVDGYARIYLEGYGSGGGSVESTAGRYMCQMQFEGLYALFQAGRAAATS